MSRPGGMPERPEDGSRGYLRVVARGCLGSTDYWGESDCVYGWTCEECPVLRERWRLEDLDTAATGATLETHGETHHDDQTAST